MRLAVALQLPFEHLVAPPIKTIGVYASSSRRAIKVLSSMHLASALTLASVNAALAQANFRRPPARRLLKRRF